MGLPAEFSTVSFRWTIPEEILEESWIEQILKGNLY